MGIIVVLTLLGCEFEGIDRLIYRYEYYVSDK